MNINLFYYYYFIRIMVSENCAVTCLSARNWASREARDPSLLANCACDAVFLFRYV